VSERQADRHDGAALRPEQDEWVLEPAVQLGAHDAVDRRQRRRRRCWQMERRDFNATSLWRAHTSQNATVKMQRTTSSETDCAGTMSERQHRVRE
jgi:hypothetical protein